MKYLLFFVAILNHSINGMETKAAMFSKSTIIAHIPINTTTAPQPTTHIPKHNDVTPNARNSQTYNVHVYRTIDITKEALKHLKDSMMQLYLKQYLNNQIEKLITAQINTQKQIGDHNSGHKIRSKSAYNQLKRQLSFINRLLTHRNDQQKKTTESQYVKTNLQPGEQPKEFGFDPDSSQTGPFVLQSSPPAAVNQQPTKSIDTTTQTQQLPSDQPIDHIRPINPLDQENLSPFDPQLDFVTTTPTKVFNYSQEIDAKIEIALAEIQKQFPNDFSQYIQSASALLQDMKDKGLLDKPVDLVQQAIVHGVEHFLKEFVPTNPLENPAEFTINVVKYSVIAAFHIATEGTFLGPEKFLYMSNQFNNLAKTDFSKMTANQRAEVIAEQAAEIIKCVLADQVGKHVSSKIASLPKDYIHADVRPQNIGEAITPEGLKVETPQDLNGPNVLKNTGEVPNTSSQSINLSTEQVKPYTHNFKYHTRIRARGVQDPIAHNFPYSFDDIILKTKPIIQKDGSLLYRSPGTLNGKNGIFEICINPNSNTIFHRTFVGTK